MTIVEVAQGKLKGTEEVLASGEKYYSFKGIPYAKPPVGNLRFKDPQPPLPWSGIKDASKHGPVCPQFNLLAGSDTEYSEDCLYLNVYTKYTNVRNKTPVMIWIHGGAFIMGSGNDDINGPQFLLDKDVIVVTINYRLGAFGFLCLENSDVPGNAGMKDQAAAIEWVKDNIENFGGDPKDITIFGVSAGGASVALHLVSPLTFGLFSKAIIQSGSSLCSWAYNTNGRAIAFKLGALLGKKTDNDVELINFLRNIPAENYANVTEDFKKQHPHITMPFTPVIEKKITNVYAFMDREPIEYILSGEFSDVPLILGATSGEGILTLKDELAISNTLNEKCDWCLSNEMKKNRNTEELHSLNAEIKRFYFGEKQIGVDTIRELVDIESDFLFIYPVYRLASILAQFGKKPVYLYYFTFVDDNNIMNKLFKGEHASQLPLAAHGSEVATIFYSTNSSIGEEHNSSVLKTINNITTLWTNFSKKGSPTPDKTLGVKWERFSIELKNYIQIDESLTTGINFLDRRMQFWNDLYKKYGLKV